MITDWRDLQIHMAIQNGRAVLELFLPEGEGEYFLICLKDAEERLAFHCMHPVKEEDPCVIQLMHPQLWQGTDCPCLYRLEIYGENFRQLARVHLPIMKMTGTSEVGFTLNDKPFMPREVYYECADPLYRGGEELPSREQIRHRLRQLAQMGANTVVLREEPKTSKENKKDIMTDVSETSRHVLGELCDETGLLFRVGKCVDPGSEIGCGAGFGHAACVRGEELFLENGILTAAYYLQKARWSTEPFVYIPLKSLHRQANGLFGVTVYSNCRKVALILNGRVFGFQSEGPELLFQDIPVKTFPVCLAAEAEGCGMSVTCYSHG